MNYYLQMEVNRSYKCYLHLATLNVQLYTIKSHKWNSLQYSIKVYISINHVTR